MLLAIEDGSFKACSDIVRGDIVRTTDGWWPCENAGATVSAFGVTLKTSSGKTLVLSENTPMTLADGRSFAASEMLGELVQTYDGCSHMWERVTDVTSAGVIQVRRLSFGGRSFAAGESPNSYIFSHNTEKP